MLALSSAAVVLLVAGAMTIHAATKISKADFGKTKDGDAVQIFTLTNSSGMELKISTYGGAIVSLKTPDRTGEMGGGRDGKGRQSSERHVPEQAQRGGTENHPHGITRRPSADTGSSPGFDCGAV